MSIGTISRKVKSILDLFVILVNHFYSQIVLQIVYKSEKEEIKMEARTMACITFRLKIC